MDDAALRYGQYVALPHLHMSAFDTPPIQADMAFFRDLARHSPIVGKSEKPEQLVDPQRLIRRGRSFDVSSAQTCILFFHTVPKRRQLSKGTACGGENRFNLALSRRVLDLFVTFSNRF